MRALHFYLEKGSVLSSLVDSRRIVLTRATKTLSAIRVVRGKKKKSYVEPVTPKLLNVAFEVTRPPGRPVLLLGTIFYQIRIFYKDTKLYTVVVPW